MACDNCKDLTAFWCPVCSDTPPAKHAVCEVCHDATCPCGKVVMRTDAELIDALRACRWILSEKIKADRWIPVGERLPEPHTNCLFASGHAVFRFRMYLHLPNGVTHWRPLPTAPEESNG